MKTFAKVIAYVLIVALLCGIVGLVYTYTNGFNEDFKTFYVEYGDEKILTEESNKSFAAGKVHTFKVKYTFDNGKSETKDYSVKVIPNVTRDFDFTVDGERYIYSKVSDLTGGFTLEKDETSFTLTLTDDLTLQKVLSSAYAGKTVVVPDEAEANNPKPYTLVISSYNGKISYNINFNITGLADNGNSGSTDSDSDNVATTYAIECLRDGDVTNLSDINISYPEKVKVGETVIITIDYDKTEYELTGIRSSIMNSDDDLSITQTDNGYTFVMPQGNVYIWISFEWVEEGTFYRIEYDTLGSGSVLSIDVDCPEKAKAGDTVTFTVSLVDLSEEYDDYEPLEITAIRLQALESGVEISEIGSGEGTFSFAMPEYGVTIMFYLMYAE